MKISLRVDKRISYSDLAKRLVSSTQTVTWKLKREQLGLAPSFDVILLRCITPVFSMHVELERSELERFAEFLKPAFDGSETRLVLGARKGGSTLPVMRRVYENGAVVELYDSELTCKRCGDPVVDGEVCEACLTLPGL